MDTYREPKLDELKAIRKTLLSPTLTAIEQKQLRAIDIQIAKFEAEAKAHKDHEDKVKAAEKTAEEAILKREAEARKKARH